MKLSIIPLCIFCLFVSVVHPQSRYNVELNLNNFLTDNLDNNSHNVKDNFTTSRLSANIFPFHFVQVNLATEYSNYGRNPNRSNLKYGGGLTLLPINNLSRYTIFLALSYQKNKYKDAITSLTDYIQTQSRLNTSAEFADNSADALLSMSYKLDDKINVRAGYNFILSGFDSDNVSDKKTNEIFTGLNLSLLGNNALDIEAGYSFERYDYLPELDTLGFNYGLLGRNAYSILEETDLNSYYVSTRLSRPLGNKTGISFTFSFREFIKNNESGIILGDSTGYLSPWVQSYSGNSFQTRIKSYIIPNIIINCGIGYWNSNYLNTVVPTYYYNAALDELSPITLTSFATKRKDEKKQMLLSFAYPIVSTSGRLFEPTLSIDITDNESNIQNYTYTKLSINFGITIK